MAKGRLSGLLITQFFGAFNDNAWKVMVFTLATRPLLQSENFEFSSQILATLSMLAFLLPMMLFSFPAGILADRFSKRSVIIATKALELVLMGAAACSLYYSTSMVLPFILLGMMGAQSALFGPAKYGILPEILPEEKLSSGNGLIEMWTMLAIIAGTGAGPLLLIADGCGAYPEKTWLGCLGLIAFAAVGLLSSFFIPRVPSVKKVGFSIRKTWNTMRTDRLLYLAILGTVCYWLIMNLLGQNALVYAKALVRDLEKGELIQGVLPASFGIGIAIGAYFCGRMSGERIEYGFIPLGAIGFAVSALLLGFLQPQIAGFLLILLMMGISSGFLVVPLQALIQSRAPDSIRGSIVGLCNVLNIFAMIAGSLIAAGMAFVGFAMKGMLITSAFLALAATLWAISVLPKSLVRLSFILLTKTFYRIDIYGQEHVPKEGPVLLTPNHISAIDALFVMATTDRMVHFIMSEYYYNKWWMRPLANLMQAIPVSSNQKDLLRSLRKAGEYLDRGEVVCIFPEGEISHTGNLLPFKRGIELIARGRKCSVIPVYLDQLWGSIFSFKGGRFFKKWPKKIPYSLSISFGSPLGADATVGDIRKEIKALECAAWCKRDEALIHHQFIRNVRHDHSLEVLADKEKKLSGLDVLERAIVLASYLRAHIADQKMVGVKLPPSISAVVANLAITMMGRVVVNISDQVPAEVSTLITSKDQQVEGSAKKIFIEEVPKTKSFFVRFLALYAPMRWLNKYVGAKKITVHDPLALIFTSGTTGVPKGVLLSHFNLTSNVNAVAQVIPHLGNQKRILANLPLCHSYGFMVMWLGLNHQLGLVMHPDPEDFKGIEELVCYKEITLLFTKPSLLRHYAEKINPKKFGSLQSVVTGAEKLPKKVADAFEEGFGLRPIEGYGATECSPVIATNTPDVRQAGIYQVGHVEASVGQALPGVLVKVVDPKTFEELPTNAEGLLLVKGPNVFKGYQNRPQLSKQALHKGWYITKDLASIDENGFITLLGRVLDKVEKPAKVLEPVKK